MGYAEGMTNLPAPPTFTPVPNRLLTGWTAAKQEIFIETLTATGSVRMSTEAVGMSHCGVYKLRHAPGGESFARAWDAAVTIAATRVRDVLIDQAIHGVPERVLIGKDKVVERRRFNHRTMIRVLQHHMPDLYPGGSTTHRRGWEERRAQEQDDVSEQEAEELRARLLRDGRPADDEEVGLLVDEVLSAVDGIAVWATADPERYPPARQLELVGGGAGGRGLVTAGPGGGGVVHAEGAGGPVHLLHEGLLGAGVPAGQQPGDVVAGGDQHQFQRLPFGQLLSPDDRNDRLRTRQWRVGRLLVDADAGARLARAQRMVLQDHVCGHHLGDAGDRHRRLRAVRTEVAALADALDQHARLSLRGPGQ